MKTIFSAILLAVFTLSCSQKKQDATVHKVKKTETNTAKKLSVKVVNAEDPICQMNTSEFLKDTLAYKGKVYGFCSTHCKEEFKKSPQKYLKK